ncbi:hypothetical protein HDU98_002121 [Podochytrium sp. JEL0797]|nr:hypothetical protein HDU98_002121 [Podochytrium sp. JEL0797]
MGLLDPISHFFKTLNHARNQIYVIAFVCFLCPGMWNALNSLPTANPLAETVKAQQNAALYICFAVMGLLAGGLNNIWGPRILAAIGGTGYALYAAAQYNIFKNGAMNDLSNSGDSFSIFSGAYLGVAAAMLWAAQGQICLTYPTEGQKGTFFAIFWIIFNTGAVMGNILSTILVWGNENTKDAAVGDSTYLVFIILMQCGSLAAMLIQPPGTIVREDQTRVETPKTDVLNEMREVMWLFANPKMLVLFVPCFASNWFYTYQYGAFNNNFNGRSTNFKAIFYWIAQAGGAWVLGNTFLDNTRYPRTQRAWTGLYIMIASTALVFGGGAVFEYVAGSKGWGAGNGSKLDVVRDFGLFVGPLVLYAGYGLYDAFFQVYTNYLIGAISNNSETLSRYSGFYKGTQSLGGGISWALTGFFFVNHDTGVTLLTSVNQFWIMVVPCSLSIVFWALFVRLYVKDTTGEEKRGERRRSVGVEARGGGNRVGVDSV